MHDETKNKWDQRVICSMCQNVFLGLLVVLHDLYKLYVSGKSGM